MESQDTAIVALSGYAVFMLLAFGLRSYIHWRRTGSTGFVGLSGTPGSAEWWGGVLFALALVVAAAAPVLQLAGSIEPPAALVSTGLQSLGIALYVAGIIGTLWAQFAMGESWRIGVNEAERTALVAGGPFRWVRNPIFTSMTVATLGQALLVPNAVSFLAVAVLVLALEVHVRLVDEPYLTRAHGESYSRYAASAGRFLPGIGKLQGSR